MAAGTSSSCSHRNGRQEAESSHWTPGHGMNISTHPRGLCVPAKVPCPEVLSMTYPQIVPEPSSKSVEGGQISHLKHNSRPQTNPPTPFFICVLCNVTLRLPYHRLELSAARKTRWTSTLSLALHPFYLCTTSLTHHQGASP